MRVEERGNQSQEHLCTITYDGEWWLRRFWEPGGAKKDCHVVASYLSNRIVAFSNQHVVHGLLGWQSVPTLGKHPCPQHHCGRRAPPDIIPNSIFYPQIHCLSTQVNADATDTASLSALFSVIIDTPSLIAIGFMLLYTVECDGVVAHGGA